MRFFMEKEIVEQPVNIIPKKAYRINNNLVIQERMVGQDGKERDFHRLDTEFYRIIFTSVRKENIWTSVTRLNTHYNEFVFLPTNYSFADAVYEHKQLIHSNKEMFKCEIKYRTRGMKRFVDSVIRFQLE